MPSAPEVIKSTTKAPPPPIVCPDDWHLFNNSCYFISRTTRDWPESQSYCQSQGGYLAIILTAEEQVRYNGLRGCIMHYNTRDILRVYFESVMNVFFDCPLTFPLCMCRVFHLRRFCGIFFPEATGTPSGLGSLTGTQRTDGYGWITPRWSEGRFTSFATHPDVDRPGEASHWLLVSHGILLLLRYLLISFAT